MPPRLWRRPGIYLLLAASAAACGIHAALWLERLAEGGLLLTAADFPLPQFLGPSLFLTAMLTLVAPLFALWLARDSHETIAAAESVPDCSRSILRDWVVSTSGLCAVVVFWPLLAGVLLIWSRAQQPTSSKMHGPVDA